MPPKRKPLEEGAGRHLLRSAAWAVVPARGPTGVSVGRWSCFLFFFKGKRASTFPLSGTLARVGRPPLHCTVNYLRGFGFPNHTHTHTDTSQTNGRTFAAASISCPVECRINHHSVHRAAANNLPRQMQRPAHFAANLTSARSYPFTWRFGGPLFCPPALELEIDCGPPIYRILAGCRYTSSHPSDRFLRVFLLTEVWATPAPHGAEIM